MTTYFPNKIPCNPFLLVQQRWVLELHGGHPIEQKYIWQHKTLRRVCEFQPVAIGVIEVWAISIFFGMAVLDLEDRR